MIHPLQKQDIGGHLCQYTRYGGEAGVVIPQDIPQEKARTGTCKRHVPCGYAQRFGANRQGKQPET